LISFPPQLSLRSAFSNLPRWRKENIFILDELIESFNQKSEMLRATARLDRFSTIAMLSLFDFSVVITLNRVGSIIDG
jgi:hypothetical protein